MFTGRGIHCFATIAMLTMALSGCFGGGSNTMTDDGMADDGMADDGMADDGMTDDGMTDDGMTDAGLEIPMGLFASPLEAQYADDATDTLESMAGTAFAPLSVFSLRDYNEEDISIPQSDDTYIESVTRDATDGISVTFVINGEMTTVTFTAEAYEEQLVGDRNYTTEPWVFSFDNPLQRQYFDTYGWGSWTDTEEQTGHFVYGVRTRPENLMSLGSASYQGYIIGDLWNDDGEVSYATHRSLIWGELALEADFDDGSIDGQVNALWTRSSRETGKEWYEFPDTNSVAITDGVIDEGRFTADWMGQDSNPDSLASDSVRGFEGDMLGEFYGPNGEEVAGVLNGRRDATDTTPEQFIHGIFGAERQ